MCVCLSLPLSLSFNGLTVKCRFVAPQNLSLLHAVVHAYDFREGGGPGAGGVVGGGGGGEMKWYLCLVLRFIK